MQTRLLGPRHALMWPGIVSPTVGIVRDLVFWSPDILHPTVTVAGARIAGAGGAPFGTFASGVGTTLGGAADSTLGEALERYALNTGGLHPPASRSPWTALPAERRLPLETFARFADGQERAAGERNLGPDDDVPWLAATSLLDGDRRLIPAFTVYGRDARFGPTVSTGTAVGRTLTDALMTGLYEAVERHVFVTTWLTERRPPVLLTHPYEHLAPHGASLFVLHLAAFDPAHVVAAVVRRRGTGGFAVGAACRQSLREATRKAVLEALQSYVTAWRRTGEERPPMPLSTLRAHAEHYLDPRHEQDARFLWAGPRQSFRDHTYASADPTAFARRLTRHLACAPYFVNLTTPELGAIGLTAVKVLLFGCLDIYPGTAPRYGADWNHVIVEHQYNRQPHPFP